MDTMKINSFVQQMIDANQATCDNIISTMGDFYTNTEQMIKSSLESMPVPNEAKKTMIQAGENYKNFMKQFISMNKNSYDHSVKALMNTQEKAEEALKITLDKLMVPQEAQNAWWQVIDVYKSGCEQMKQVVDANYAKMEGLSAS